jgi:membrane protease YdiL (CAAX protease family)
MSAEPASSQVIGFWRTVQLLLGAARRRSSGRLERQQQLLKQRTGSSTNTLSGLAILATWALMAVLNGGAAFILNETVSIAQRVEVQEQGKLFVSAYFIKTVRELENARTEDEKARAHKSFEQALEVESGGRAFQYRQSREEAENVLREAVRTQKSTDFVDADAVLGVSDLNRFGPVPAMLATLVLVWWLTTLIFQGEGLELDLQRRRHPMWEWLFSHPVTPGAVFFAEMLSPIAANPIYVTAPLFFMVLYGSAYDFATGLAAAVLIGVPVAIATACAGKALEIGVILRFPPRTRGAITGLMGWLGYAAMMSFLFIAASMETVVTAAAHVVRPVATAVPWPWFSWAIGLRPGGSLSFFWGLFAWWVFFAVVITGAVWFTIWGAQRGLSGASEAKSTVSATRIFRLPILRRDPLYRKEILWFFRDRGAIVQAILIPVTIAAVQLFNLRGLAREIYGSWQYFSGAAVVFGTYLLWILGPRSLASEGPALWIAQTWPRGLEELMKAKARLWFLVANGLVTLILIYALIRFPAAWWQLVLIGIGWYAFGRSMALKSVTLVTTPSSSGEPEPVPKGRRWAASLGMLTFAVGILSQRWSLAIVGIVYSWLTAAAMWENFRARLPYLFDPWSEKMPPAPTLMHAMIAISALLEAGSVIIASFMLVVGQFGGKELVPIVHAIAFGAVAFVVWLVVAEMLHNRGVDNKDVWCWRRSKPVERWWWSGNGGYDNRFRASLWIGAASGFVLGLLAIGYVWVFSRVGPFTEIFQQAQEQAKDSPNLIVGLFIIAVFCAPFAEEYLFRGLLFRALNREWGGWRAILGSAAFFMIYHQPMAWLPVGAVGVATALLFKKSGRLAPAVALHMVYNAVVVGSEWIR